MQYASFLCKKLNSPILFICVTRKKWIFSISLFIFTLNKAEPTFKERIYELQKFYLSLLHLKVSISKLHSILLSFQVLFHINIFLLLSKIYKWCFIYWKSKLMCFLSANFIKTIKKNIFTVFIIDIYHQQYLINGINGSSWTICSFFMEKSSSKMILFSYLLVVYCFSSVLKNIHINLYISLLFRKTRKFVFCYY